MASIDESPAQAAVEDSVPPDGAVRSQLERILESEDFAPSERIKAFLRYVVEETLAGRSERLKEYGIATDVFDRDESFDPQTNTIVRVEAGRLRRRLERYYLTVGQRDEIRIDLPKGTYVPLFRRVRAAVPPAAPDVATVPETTDVAAAVPAGPSIAVLPFENLSGDSDQGFFVDGITEEIINDLTRFPNLRVMSRHTTFKYKGRHADTREVGQDLGVRYVLEGSVRKAGDMVRVTGQLIEAASGTHLFSETYDRDLSAQNIFQIQDDIAERIVAAVGQPYGIMARDGVRQAHAKPAESLDAYDAVLRFYEYWLSYAPDLYRPVRQALERAVTLDPSYAGAWAALAIMILDEVRLVAVPPRKGDQLDRALSAAQRAVTLDPESSLAYHALFSVHFHRGELDEFQATAERALALNPNHADMLADYGLMLAFSGDWERGKTLVDKAKALSPTHPGWFHAGDVADRYRHEDYEAALAAAKKVQMPGFYLTYMMLAMCCGQLGRDREGRAACDKLLELAPDFPDMVWGLLEAWNFPEDLTRHIVEGLRKAGLRIADPPG